MNSAGKIITVTNSQIRCKKCQKEYKRQNTTKLNKKKKIINIIKEYGNYVFNDESLNKKIIELKLLANTDKINNIDSHKYKINELKYLQDCLELAKIYNAFKKSN